MSSTTIGAGALPERRTVVGRPMTQGVFGIIAVVLGIVALAITKAHPTVPMYLGAIAEIALGLALMFIGAALSVSYARLVARASDADTAGGQIAGTTVGMFAGGAIIILGILALLQVASPILMAINAILIGTGLLWTSAAAVRMTTIEGDLMGERNMARRVTEETVFATASVGAMAGIAVAILGILAVVGFDAVALTVIAMIVAGMALVVGGSSFSSRVSSMLVPRA